MNDKIKNIFERSIVIDNDVRRGISTTTIDYNRFAEDIIRECIIAVNESPFPTWAEVGDERRVFSEMIKNRFDL
jgi:hypothetical protein